MNSSKAETNQLFEAACREIIEGLKAIPSHDKRDVNRLKVKACRKYHVKLPSNSELIKLLNADERKRLLPILKLKPVRTISGVNVVAVMTKPWPCPKAKPCVYCPGGLASGTPQAYTGREPAALRGLQHGFDPCKQVKNRIKQLNAMGHEVSKIELIILGGTFTALPMNYQVNFIERCLDAINGVKARSLEKAKVLAETSRIRNVGISVETRPDWAKERQADDLISLGVTRVELGVQTIYDDIYNLINREHTVYDVAEATRILKDSGFKIAYHVMPNIFTSYEKDLEMFETLFRDQRFKPDAIKIYPTLVLEGTKLNEMWREGKYNPYPLTNIIDLIIEAKKIIPKWVRIQRIQRDIPSNLIIAGVKASNLRQLVHERLSEIGVKCRCIRCREVGHRMLKEGVEPDPDYVELMIIREKASEGQDVFITYEDPVNDVLIGYLRLRIPSEKTHRPEVSSTLSSIVRELHIFGPMVPVSEHRSNAWQHQGYGKRLIAEAERLSVEDFDRDKVVILSALGTKRYYMKLGYKYDGAYMSKMVN